MFRVARAKILVGCPTRISLFSWACNRRICVNFAESSKKTDCWQCRFSQPRVLNKPYSIILCSHARQETREGQQRPVSKDYYYIHFHATIDAIKYRIFHLTERVKDLYKPNEEKKDYHCPRCLSQYTTLQVLDSFGPTGFICHKCGGALQEQHRAAGDSTGHEKQSKLMSQLEPLLKLLKEIDSNDIPNNDFESAFAVMVPVQRNEFVNPIRATELVPSRGPPAAVKGVTETKVIPLEISVTTGSERTTADQAAEAQRKADLAAQNALPVWHTKSTVTGEGTDGGKERERNGVNGGAAEILKREEDEKNEGALLTTELDAYYRQLQQEKEKEAREDRESDESGSGEDDEDFEDIGIGPSVDASQPSTPAINNEIKAELAESTATTSKKRGSESGSSLPGTNISTPVSSGGAPDDGEENGPAPKRVKIAEESQEGVKINDQAQGEGVAAADKEPRPDSKPSQDNRPSLESGPTAAAAADKDSDEDEEAEFEDAL